MHVLFCSISQPVLPSLCSYSRFVFGSGGESFQIFPDRKTIGRELINRHIVSSVYVVS